MNNKLIIKGIETKTKTILFNDIDKNYKLFNGHILNELNAIAHKYPNINDSEKNDCFFLINERLAQTKDARIFDSAVNDISKNYCTIFIDLKNNGYDNSLSEEIEKLIESKMCLYTILMNFETLSKTNFQSFYDFLCKHTFNIQLNIRNLNTPLIEYITPLPNKSLIISDETDFFNKISYAIEEADSIQVPLIGLPIQRTVEIINLLHPIGKKVFCQPYNKPFPNCFDEDIELNRVIDLYESIRTEIDDVDYNMFMNCFGLFGMRNFEKKPHKLYESKKINLFISKINSNIPYECSQCKINAICSCSNNVPSGCVLENYVLQI